jgi:hypothetical protein
MKRMIFLKSVFVALAACMLFSCNTDGPAPDEDKKANEQVDANGDGVINDADKTE